MSRGHAFVLALLLTTVAASGAERWTLDVPDAVLSDAERAKVRTGSAIVAVLPAQDTDVAVVGVARVAIDSHRFVSWTRRVEDLQRGRYVSLAHRFSNPPTLDDVRELTLDDDDLDDLRECRPGDCGLKLSAPEMTAIRRVIGAAGVEWKTAAQDEFRTVIVNRARAYAIHGDRAAPPYQDQKAAISPGDAFEALAIRMNLETTAPATMAPYLRSYPAVNQADVEPFLYWSKEILGGTKPIVTITHVSVFPASAVTVAFKQVYASHYLTASLSLTRFIPAADESPGRLVYARRSSADLLGGAFGGVIRRLIERRIRDEGPAALDGMRRRLETQPPDTFDVSGSGPLQFKTDSETRSQALSDRSF